MPDTSSSAFPALEQRNGNDVRLTEASQSMTLRQYYAGQALAGCIEFCLMAAFKNGAEPQDALVQAAWVSYKAADAMLEAESKI